MAQPTDPNLHLLRNTAPWWAFQSKMSFSTKAFQFRRAIIIIIAVILTSFIFWNKQHIINQFRDRPIDINGLPGYPKDLPRAREISAKDLIDRHWTSDNRIIHQSWENSKIPSKWVTWSDSWRVKHPDWNWVLWTNEDNRALVKAKAPWFLETYDALPGEIRRADVMRNFYMFFFGG